MQELFSDRRSRLLPWAAWSILLCATWAVYLPGLSGGFLFDDFVNLPALGAMGPVDDWSTFWRYLTSGTADPTGRPLALLSFLIDAHDWPADPAPFLRTNLILHLVNGTLLLVLLRMLGHTLSGRSSRNDSTALLAAGLWLLHPLFVSTTLYIVQREAMLPATFVLLGLIAYIRGRVAYQHSNGRLGMTWMIVGLVAGTGLAFLSKANGILLPLLALVLESTVFATAARQAPLDASAASCMRRFVATFLIVPSLLVMGYLASRAWHWSHTPFMRGWTVGERALTEPRVLLDYLALLFVPRSVSTGLYNDAYQVSRDLLHPWTTLAAILVLAALIAGALRWRTRAPILCAAVLFFLGGHVLESTVVPLEIYFEHRNYLPALLLFWPLSYALFNSKRSRVFVLCTAGAMLSLVAVTTYQRASIWGKPEQLAALWARSNPDSARAQATLANKESARGRPDLAMQRLAPRWRANPADLQLALNYISASCASGKLSGADAERLSTTLRTATKGGKMVTDWLRKSLTLASSGTCTGLTLEAIDQWLQAADANPMLATTSGREKSIATLRALLALERGRPDEALMSFDRALMVNASPEVAAGQTALLASNGHYVQALKHLDTYERIKQRKPARRRGMAYVHEAVLDRQQYWPRELAILRMKVQQELDQSQSPGGAAD